MPVWALMILQAVAVVVHELAIVFHEDEDKKRARRVRKVVQAGQIDRARALKARRSNLGTK